MSDLPDYPKSKDWFGPFDDWESNVILRFEVVMRQDFEELGLVQNEDFEMMTVKLPYGTTLREVQAFYLYEGFGPLEISKETYGSNSLTWKGDDFFITIIHFEPSYGQEENILLYVLAPYLK